MLTGCTSVRRHLTSSLTTNQMTLLRRKFPKLNMSRYADDDPFHHNYITTCWLKKTLSFSDCTLKFQPCNGTKQLVDNIQWGVSPFDPCPTQSISLFYFGFEGNLCLCLNDDNTLSSKWKLDQKGKSSVCSKTKTVDNIQRAMSPSDPSCAWLQSSKCFTLKLLNFEIVLNPFFQRIISSFSKVSVDKDGAQPSVLKP